jgi:hypothetical protein
MMRRSGRIGIGITMMLAVITTLGATAYAAAPEFGRCVKVAKGAGVYASSKCTGQGGERKFEWMPGPGPKRHFTTSIKSATSVTLETVGGIKFSCTGETGSGEIFGDTSVAGVEMVLTGCVESADGGCLNRGEERNGEIVLSGLSGQLGVITKGETALKNKIGLDLTPVDFSFTCKAGDITGTVRGSLIVPVKTNAMVLTETLKFSQSKGKQKPEQFEGEIKDVLESSIQGAPFVQTGLGLSAIQRNEEKIEVNSVV